MKINLDSIKDAAAKLLSAVSHLHFAGEVVEGFLGHKLPDDANKLAKLVSKLNEHGGDKTYVDEAKMIQTKLAGIKGLDGNITASELKVLRGLERHSNGLYGDGFFGDLLYKRMGNKQRPALLHLTTPEKDVVDKIARVVGKKTVYDEITRTEPGSDALLKKYLKYLVREMRAVARVTVGSREEKDLAGYQRGLTILEDDGFPVLQFAEFAQMADAAIEALPDAARATAHQVKQATQRVATVIGTHSPRVQAAIESNALAINQAVIDRSDRIDERKWYHPLRLFGW